MRGVFLFLFASVLSIDLCGQKNEADSIKCWDIHNKLNWKDFKGKVEKTSMFKAACPSHVIVYRVRQNDSTYTYKVKVIFYRYRAWTKTTNRYSLTHEQLHFDITELYGRKLRKKIKEEFKGRYEDGFGVIINGLITELLEQQKVYDERTMHGGSEGSQLKWSKKIKDELDQLKEYSSMPQDCTQ